jgi:hypothetical protein
VVDPGHQGLRELILQSEGVEYCLATEETVAGGRVEAEIAVDASGQVTRATLRSNDLARPLGACLEKALPKVALRCADDGNPHIAAATLTISSLSDVYR